MSSTVSSAFHSCVGYAIARQPVPTGPAACAHGVHKDGVTRRSYEEPPAAHRRRDPHRRQSARVDLPLPQARATRETATGGSQVLSAWASLASSLQHLSDACAQHVLLDFA